MQNSFQKVSLNNPAKINTLPAVTKPKTTEVKETPVNDNKNYFNSKTITGSLLGLAAIGGSIWAVKSGHFQSKNNIQKISPEQIQARINDTLDDINKLKKLIRDDFLAKRNHIINKFFNSNNTNNFMHFKDSQDLRAKIEAERSNYDRIEKIATPNILEQKQIIKDKFVKLINDPEFKELRQIRKSLLQAKKSTKTEDEMNIVSKKINIVNDMIINKVYPENSELFKQLYNADSSKILELINGKYETYEQYLTKYKELNPVPTDFNFDSVKNSFYHSKKLSFEDVFPEEVDIIKNNTKILKKAEDRCLILEILKKRYLEKYTEFVNNYQKTEAVIDLKKQVRQLRSLRKQLQSCTRAN